MLQGLTLTNGLLCGIGRGSGERQGAGILALGSVTIRDSIVSKNGVIPGDGRSPISAAALPAEPW